MRPFDRRILRQLPTDSTSTELDQIVALIAEHPDGIAVSRIATHVSMPRRTLQKRLRELVRGGRLVLVGRGRGARYQSVRPAADAPVDIPVSPEGDDVRRYVAKAMTARRPVGYERSLLDDYEPNESFYLREEVRRRLGSLGARATAGQPAGTFARRILDRLLIDLSWSSSRLEGNTYSLLETERLLRAGQSAEGKAAFETQMILNHKGAIEYLVDGADEIGFNRHTLLSLHALLSDNLLGDPRSGGRLRTIAVGIGGSVFHPVEPPQLIEELFEQVLTTAAAIDDPFEQAVFVLVHVPYLQPFDDVNKRVSRLAANIPFIRANLCPLSFLDVPTELYVHAVLGVYELTRVELMRDLFVWAYERSAERYRAVRQSLGEPDPFRLQYRDLLRDIVGRCVREHVTVSVAMSELAPGAIAPDDIHQFERAVRDELDSLHEGNIARYRLRPSELQAWRTRSGS